jgi:hypothetical protein
MCSIWLGHIHLLSLAGIAVIGGSRQSICQCNGQKSQDKIGRPPSDKSRTAPFPLINPFSVRRRVLGPFWELLSATMPTGDNSRFLFPVTFCLATCIAEPDSACSGGLPLSKTSSSVVSTLGTTGSGVKFSAVADRRSRFPVSTRRDSGASGISCALLLGDDGRRSAICASPLMAERTAEPPHLKQSTGRLFRSRVLYKSRSSNSSCLLKTSRQWGSTNADKRFRTFPSRASICGHRCNHHVAQSQLADRSAALNLPTSPHIPYL